MLEPLLSEEDDDESTTASGSSESSVSTEFEAYKPTFTQKLKQAVGKYLITSSLPLQMKACYVYSYFVCHILIIPISSL